MGEGDRAGEALVEQAAQGVDVGAAVDRLTADLLGGHVVHRSQRALGRLLGRIGDPAAEAEVTQPGVQRLLGAVGAGDEDVGGLDVAMDQPGSVGGLQSPGELLQDGHGGVRGEPALAADHPLQV